MKTSILKRITGLALAASMLISYVPVPVLAAQTDGLCEHHPAHTAQCGYVEAAAECPCAHEHTQACYAELTQCVHTHDDTCGYVAPVEGQSCTCEPDENGVLTHAEGCGYREAVAEVPCGHVCTEESGCVTKVLSCQHVHDETCGYAAAVEEQPCTFVCTECAEEDEEDAAVAQVKALIDALPALAEVKAMDQKGQQDAYAQLQNAYDAYDQLTEAQQAQIEGADAAFDPLFAYFNSLTSAAPNDDSDIGTGTPDGTPPVLNGITLSATTVTVPGTVEVVMSASDDVSGVEYGSASFYCENTGKRIYCNLSATYYDESTHKEVPYADGKLHGMLEIDQYVKTGTFRLADISIWDKAGNYAEYDDYCSEDTVENGYARHPIPDTVKTIRLAVTNIGADIVTSTGKDSFLEEVQSAEEDAHIVADFSGSTELSADVFTAIAGTDKTLDLTSEGITWRFEGSDITNTVKSIDLGVDIVQVEQDASLEGEAIDGKLGDNPGVVMKFAENGTLPGKATIQVKVDYAMRQYLGTDKGLCVYYYNNQTGELELVAENLQVINDTYVEFCITHCSDYVLTTASPREMAVDGGGCGDHVTWVLDEDGTLTIGGTGAMYDFAISGGEYGANADTPWKAYKNAIQKVVIKSGVTSIGNGAFAGCGELIAVSLPNTLTSIGDHAFEAAVSLKSLDIPEGVTYLGKYAVCICPGLVSVTLPEGITAMSQSVFDQTWPETITVPSTATAVESKAFAYMSGRQTKLIFTGNAPTFADDAFYSSTGTVWYPKDNPTWTEDVFQNYGGKNITWLPIGEEPDNESGEPTYTTASGTWGDNITWTLDDSGLLTISGSGKMLNRWEIQAQNGFPWLEFADSITAITVEAGITSLACSSFRELPYLETVKLPDSLERIEANCFTACASLKNIFLGSGVRFIDDGAFNFCTALTKVTIPENVQTLGYGAFAYCENLQKVTLCEGTTSIGEYAFRNCFALTDINIPKSVAKIEMGAFEGCTRLPGITIPEGVTELGKHVFYDCTNLGEIRFLGDAPQFHPYALLNLTATAYYPGDNETWTDSVLQNYGGSIRWVASGEAPEVPSAISLSQNYLDLTVGETAQIIADVQPARLADMVQWKVEAEENSVISVDENGLVTANGAGTAYVVASIPGETGELTARCRVDVTERFAVEGIQLSTQTVTAELYKTDYAGFEILLKLPQNYSLASASYSLRTQNTGVAMESARFTDETVAKLFDIRVLDDRSVLVVPTEYAVENPKEVKSRYVSTVTATVQGQAYESEALTLNVKKTMPKLTATVPAFNSFYSGQSQTISVTGGTVRAIYADESKNTAKTTAIPTWLTLRSGILTLTEDAPLKSVSGKAYILVETEEWRIPTALTLSVKNTYKTPQLKLSATSVTMSAQADLSSGVELQLQCRNKKDTLPDLGVTNLTVSGDSGYRIENFDANDGTFTLKAKEGFRAGKLTLWASFADTEVSVPLTLTVRTAPVKLKLSKTSVSLNSAVADSAVITVTATPADYMLNLTEDNLRLTDSRGNALADTGILDVRASGNQIWIAVNENTPEKASYKLTVEAGGTKVTTTVNVISAVPTVTYKAAGTLDHSFPEQAVRITPSFKNYSGGFTLEAMTAENSKREDVTDQFQAALEDGMISVTCGEAVPAGSYTLKLTLELADGSTVTNTVKVTVKRTAVKLKLSTGSLSLNKRVDGREAVKVTCTTKGYDFTEPIWQIMDKTGKNPADGMLDVEYANGELTVAVNDETAYGATYKVLVRADEYAPAATVTVTIPTEAKSNVTAALRASGKIDVIRDGSAVTVTPTYRNATALTDWQEELLIYSSEDGYAERVNDRFCIEPNGNGSYTITKAEGTVLDHSSKYKVKLVSTYQGVTVETALVSLSVSMGSARLTAKFSDTTLFAKDVHDRALVWFESGDLTLNDVSRVAIRDAKYRDMFEVIDYGDGLFAIGYKDNTVHPSLITAKSTTSVTLNLDVFLEGNQTSKANTTAKLKLTIAK